MEFQSKLNENKKPLKRPPFSKGYGNFKKTQKQVKQEIPVKCENKKPSVAIPSIRQKPSVVIPPVRRNPLITKRRNSLTFSKKTAPKPAPNPRGLLRANLKPSNETGAKLPGEKSSFAKQDEVPDLDSEVCRQLIVQWCQKHKKSLSDFSSFSFKSSFNDNRKFPFRPACKSLLETKDASVEKRLETLYTYLKHENFHPSLMFTYLSKQGEKFAQLKDYSLFWIILAECKLAERSFVDVRQILQDGYKLKAKPPSRLIECYQTFVDSLMNIFVQQKNVINVLPKEETIADVKEIVLEFNELKYPTENHVEYVRQFDNDNEANEDFVLDGVWVSNSPVVEHKQLIPVTSELLENSNETVEHFFTPRRKSVVFADPIDTELGQMNLAMPMQPETLPIGAFADHSAEQLNQSYTIDSNESQLMFDSASGKANRRTDVFDHSQMFLSSQRKFALFSEKNTENYAENKPFMTPVRRSTRVDQENLPVELREKLTLFDSPSEFEAENYEVRRNPALRASFGGKIIQETFDESEKKKKF